MESVERSVEVRDRRVEVEHLCEVRVRQVLGDLCVGAHELLEVERFVPRPHRVALHRAVGLVAIDTVLDECEQQPVREEEPV